MFQSVFIYVYFKCLKIMKIHNICCNFLFLFLVVLEIGAGPCPQLASAQSQRFSSNFWNFLKQRTNLKTAQDYSSQSLTQQSQGPRAWELVTEKDCVPSIPRDSHAAHCFSLFQGVQACLYPMPTQHGIETLRVQDRSLATIQRSDRVS